MISEVETLYSRLEKLRMTSADRELAKARLAQAEAFAAGLHAIVSRLSRRVRGANRGPRQPGCIQRPDARQDLWGPEAL